MGTAVTTAAGVVLVITTMLDVFFTVLFPASGRGPIRKPLERLLWSAFGGVRRLRSPDRRRRVLCYAGPAQITATLTVWFVVLVVGWALIYQPALGDGVRAVRDPSDTSWSTAIYFSGFNLTTLGTGDVVAVTGSYRLLQIVEAGTGFAAVTMVIAYFLSVYPVLVRRNAFAMALHQRSGGTDCAPELLATLCAGGPDQLHGHLAETAGALRTLAETHRSYPVLTYFHYREDFYALPRILFLCRDTVSLLRSTVSGDLGGRPDIKAAALDVDAAADALVATIRTGRRTASRQHPDQHRGQPGGQHRGQPGGQHRGQQHPSGRGGGDAGELKRSCPALDPVTVAHQRTARQLLVQAGVAVEHAQGSLRCYAALRGSWEPTLSAVAAGLAYQPWPPACRCTELLTDVFEVEKEGATAW